MPEIKTRQNQGKPVLSTAQQQMQRSFVKARQEQAAQKQNEQSESPNSYAEEKISRTAEDAVRDVRTLARESVRTIRQRSDMSASGDSGPTYDSSPAGSAAMEYSGNPAVRRQIAEASHRHGPVRQTATESPEPQSRVVQASRPIRTREQQAAVSSAVEASLSPTQQQAARKATAENIVKQKQEQKNALRSELAQNTGILESIPQETTPASSSDIKVVKSPPAQNLRNGGSAPEVPTSSVEVPIKKKASVPIRTRQGPYPSKRPEVPPPKLLIPQQRRHSGKRKRPPWPPPRKMPTPLLPQAAGPQLQQRKPQKSPQSWRNPQRKRQRPCMRQLLPVVLPPYW